MKLETFFEKFNQLAEAPDAVAAFRESIMQWAIRGRLVQQSEDESALALVLSAKKAKISTRGAHKGTWLSENVVAPFLIPTNWEWLCVGDAIDMINGRAFKSTEWSESGLPIIRIQNLNNPFAPYNYFSGDYDEKNFVTRGSFLISWSGTPGTSFGAFIWDREDGLLNQHIFKCNMYSSIITKEYLKLAINARLDEMISHAQGGVGLQHITKGKLETICLPLPPLAEQKRIVAKVSELMALCDLLQARQQQRDTRHAALTRASRARFTDAPTPANLNFLFHKSFDLPPADLRKSILTLAVQGKLVPQGPNDEPANALLARIVAERRNLKRTNEIEVRVLSNEEGLGYDIPESWQWQSLDDLLIFGPTNGFSPKAVDYETPVRSLTLSATTSGRFKGEHSKFITTDVPIDSELWLRDGDILVQRGNSIDYVGIAAVYRGDSNQFIYPDLMMKLRVSSALNVSFIHIAMSQETARDFLRTRASGTSGSMPKINQTTLKSLPLPIPPLAEQGRIVAKVDQLMALVDELETHLLTARSGAKNLLEALVTELTAAGGVCSQEVPA